VTVKPCKPFFSSTSAFAREFNLSQNGLPIQDVSEIASVLNVHFNQITDSLNLHDWNPLYNPGSLIDPVLCAIDKFKIHPSILKVKSSAKSLDIFNFREITTEEVIKLIASWTV